MEGNYRDKYVVVKKLDNYRDKYVIIKKLNSRNSVFVVKDNSDDSLWVEKIIESENVEIYRRLMGAEHRNIAAVREMYMTEEGAVVIEEYVRGESIAEIIDNGGIFTEFQVKEISQQICDGVNFLHKMGIVHRDISSNNVILDSQNNVKIVDMGIARFMDPYKKTDTYLMGTAGFASPEQFGFRQTDERSDIFSIGVLMNVMLTGKLPNEVLYDGIPRLERIILKAVEIEPERRYKNADRLKKALMTMPTEKDNKFMALFKELPGTRTGTVWKIVLSSCVYLFIFQFLLMMNVMFLFEGRFVDIAGVSIWAITGMFIPCLLAGNYLYYIDRCKLTRHLPQWTKRIVCLIIGFGTAVLSFTIFYILFVEIGIGS